jgi:hypothetical protein
MKLTSVVALLLVASPLVVGCSSDESCDDVDALSEQLADSEPDDADYNDLVERLNRAEADCNAQ